MQVLSLISCFTTRGRRSFLVHFMHCPLYRIRYVRSHSWFACISQLSQLTERICFLCHYSGYSANVYVVNICRSHAEFVLRQQRYLRLSANFCDNKETDKRTGPKTTYFISGGNNDTANQTVKLLCNVDYDLVTNCVYDSISRLNSAPTAPRPLQAPQSRILKKGSVAVCSKKWQNFQRESTR